MKVGFDNQANRYRQLDNWFYTNAGKRVAQAFKQSLLSIGDEQLGGKLLQLGHCGENAWLSALNFRHKWLASLYATNQSTFVSPFTALPLARDSIDCVLAPLTLEFSAATKNPLDEIDRILKPMGYAIFLGVNPFGLWGLKWRFKSTGFTTHPQLISSLKIKRAMLQRGYRQSVFNSFYYIPPVNNEFLIKKLDFLNEVGKMILPYPAGFYCLMVQKQAYCLPTPILEKARTMFWGNKASLQLS